MTFNRGDSLVLICAFAFAIHMLLTGRFVSALPVIPLTIVQLFAVGIYSTVSTAISPEPVFYLIGKPPLSWQDSLFPSLALLAILIAGIIGLTGATNILLGILIAETGKKFLFRSPLSIQRNKLRVLQLDRNARFLA
ncbi:hypothetical protein [Marinomonas rhizomae]|uniref:Uncharacterized protein n=1 Tax=Marinomonas rhizomae TaxID=491948 RepID=A0A366J2D5_9GAMM|nr:hypothetical protein [Marinomonas rhizomae]RBP81221.1 hypothetical protein DFP80_110193 [Marinomonas rhizomae]